MNDQQYTCLIDVFQSIKYEGGAIIGLQIAIILTMVMIAALKKP